MNILNKYISCFLSAIAVLSASALAQSPSRGSTILSFVVLPMRSSQDLTVVNERFVEEFIRTLKAKGHNAISTRYLGAALQDSRFGQLESCTTLVCMSHLVRLIGTRFLIHGSLISDSSVQTIELHVVDVPNKIEVAQQKETFVGDVNSLDLLVPDFTERVLKTVLVNMSKETKRIGIADGATFTDSEPAQVLDTNTIPMASDEVASNTIIDTSETSGNDDQNVEIIGESEAPADSSTNTDESNNQDLVLASGPADSVSALSGSLYTDTISNKSTGDIVSSIDTLSTKKNQIYQPVDSPSFAENANAMTEVFSKKRQKPLFRTARLTAFGAAAVVGFVGGINADQDVRRSLDKEKQLFAAYMESDAEHTNTRYKEYALQTEKTNKIVRKRSLFFILGGVALAGLSVSILF